jgi:hypothetical protein
MSLLFAWSCLVVAAFCARTLFVRDDVEDAIWLADIRSEEIVEEIVGRLDSIEADREAVLIYWTSLEVALGSLTQVAQRLQNISTSLRLAAQFVQNIILY